MFVDIFLHAYKSLKLSGFDCEKGGNSTPHMPMMFIRGQQTQTLRPYPLMLLGYNNIVKNLAVEVHVVEVLLVQVLVVQITGWVSPG